jgi:hypothetical protein
LLPELAREFLARQAEGRAIERVHVGVDEKQQFTYQLT